MHNNLTLGQALQRIEELEKENEQLRQTIKSIEQSILDAWAQAGIRLKKTLHI